MDKSMKKIIAVAVVVLLLSVCVIVGEATSDKSTNANSVSVISRVNTEGSSVFISNAYMKTHDLASKIDPSTGMNYFVHKSDNSTALFDLDTETGLVKFDKKYAGDWDQMVFGTPGKTSIQHKMLQAVVESMGLKFVSNSQDKVSNAVYFDQSMTNKDKWNSLSVDGGTIWQPVCGAIESGSDKPATRLYGTEQYDPGHSCCVIAANNNYLLNNEALIIRFLAAYIESVDLVNKAISDSKKGMSTDTYEKLVKMGADQTGQTDEVVKQALLEVKYTYGLSSSEDTDDNPLNSLRTAASGLVDGFSKDNTLSRTVQDLGYKDTKEFADAYVNDYYLSKALLLVQDVADGKVDTKTFDSARISVAVIGGDIHQIALHFGNSKEDKNTCGNLFQKYGIQLTVSTATNGAGVATSLQNGAANIGIMGLPPITITTVNSALNHASYVSISGTVTDADGKAIPDAKVQFILNDGKGTVYKEVRTDSEGRYKLDDILVGKIGSVVCGDQSVKFTEVYKTVERCDLEKVVIS